MITGNQLQLSFKHPKWSWNFELFYYHIFKVKNLMVFSYPLPPDGSSPNNYNTCISDSAKITITASLPPSLYIGELKRICWVGMHVWKYLDVCTWISEHTMCESSLIEEQVKLALFYTNIIIYLNIIIKSSSTNQVIHIRTVSSFIKVLQNIDIRIKSNKKRLTYRTIITRPDHNGSGSIMSGT